MRGVVVESDESPPLGFAEFFAREHLRLGRAIYLLTGDRDEAEELVQDALARAYERWDQVARMSEPAGYVYRIASNLHRRRMRRRRRPVPVATSPGQIDPSEAIDRDSDLWDALATLTREQREAIVLVELLGYDAEAAAKVLGIQPSSVRVRVHRARAKLRQILGGNDV